MSKVKMISPAVPNVPWQDKPEGHTHNDVTIQMIDKSKVTHDLVYRDLHGNSGMTSSAVITVFWTTI